MMVDQCGGCAGEGKVDLARLRALERDDWQEDFSHPVWAHERYGRGWRAEAIHPRYGEAFVEEDLTHVRFELQDVHGFDRTDAYLEEAVTPEDIEAVTYELVVGKLAITSTPTHSFFRTNVSGATMAHVHLGGSDFTGATLAQADLRQSNLAACVFTDADLTGADLRPASLRGAILRRTKLAGARLQGADLTGAYLVGADLTGATIEEADSLLDARLASAIGLTPEQLVRCQERGARLDDPERVPDWATLRGTTAPSFTPSGATDGPGA